MWNKARIDEEHKLKADYGLKNLRELWKATSEIRRVRRNVREVLSGRVSDEVGKGVIGRLARYNIVGENAVLDDLLLVKPATILERRLQTVVYRKGLAKTLKQARQLVTHGFIAVNGQRTKSPGYMLKKGEEDTVTYYKPITIEQAAPAAPQAAAVAAEAPAPEATEPKGE